MALIGINLYSSNGVASIMGEYYRRTELIRRIGGAWGLP